MSAGTRLCFEALLPQTHFLQQGQTAVRSTLGDRGDLSTPGHRWDLAPRGTCRSPAQTQLTRRIQDSAVPSRTSPRHVQPLPHSRAPPLPVRTPVAPGDAPKVGASGFDRSIWKGFGINHVYCARAEPGSPHICRFLPTPVGFMSRFSGIV